MNIFFREPPGQLLLESNVIFDVLCRCYYLYNFKNDRNTHWVLLSVKPQPSSMALYSNTLSLVFSRFFKLCKWYQIVQSMTDSHKLLFIKIVKPWCSKFVYSFIVKLGSMVKLRSSHPEFLLHIGVLRNSAKFTGKRLWQSLFLNKVAGVNPVADKCFPVNITKFLRTPFLTERLRATASILAEYLQKTSICEIRMEIWLSLDSFV